MPSYRAACLRIAATRPVPRSFLGCGTTTWPERFGCLKTWWEPRTRSKTHPAAINSRMRSALFMMRTIHTAPAGVNDTHGHFLPDWTRAYRAWVTLRRERSAARQGRGPDDGGLDVFLRIAHGPSLYPCPAYHLRIALAHGASAAASGPWCDRQLPPAQAGGVRPRRSVCMKLRQPRQVRGHSVTCAPDNAKRLSRIWTVSQAIAAAKGNSE